jgi:predicted transport protein
VYLTNTLEDADIMECWLIRELKPELNKRHQPDASTWKEVSKDILLSSATKELKEMFDKLRSNILARLEVKEKVRKGWITYQISAMKNFCAIMIRKDYLQIDLKVDKSDFNDPNNLSFEIKPTQAWTFNRRIEMYDGKQFDGIFKLVMQAYNIMSSKKREKE